MDLFEKLNKIKHEISEYDNYTNLNVFLDKIKDDKNITERLNELYYEETGVLNDFNMLFNRIQLEKDNEVAISAIDFILSCGDVFKIIEDKLNEDAVSCSLCNIKGSWGEVTERGNFFKCDECGDIHCTDCLVEEGIFNDDVIICNKCKKRNKDRIFKLKEIDLMIKDDVYSRYKSFDDTILMIKADKDYAHVLDLDFEFRDDRVNMIVSMYNLLMEESLDIINEYIKEGGCITATMSFGDLLSSALINKGYRISDPDVIKLDNYNNLSDRDLDTIVNILKEFGAI